MKQNGYQIVCELFGFGKPDPTQHLTFCLDMIVKNYKSVAQKYSKEDGADYRLLIDHDWNIAKEVIYRNGKKLESELNGSFDVHRFHGVPIGLLYSKQSKRYDYFCFWLIDIDQGKMTSAVFQFKYQNNRLNVSALKQRI